MDVIADAHRARLAAAPATTSLDDRTWDDLHLDEVFGVIDRTESTLGQQALYHRLRSTHTGESLAAFEALVERLGTDAAARERAQLALARLQDPNGYDLWWLNQPDAVDTAPWYAIFPVLAMSALAAIPLAILWLPAWQILVALLGTNVLIRYATDKRIGAAAGAFRQLAPIVATAERLAFLDGDNVRVVDPLGSHVPGLLRLKAIARWVSGNPFMLPIDSSWLAVAVNDVVSVAYEYLNWAFLLDANAVHFGASELQRCAPALLRVIAAIGDVDAEIAVASFREGTDDWVRPRFAPPGAPAVMRDLRHPLVSQAVPNSITLGPPWGVLVTGSNMSGKSTFLRTVGINCVLAQTIHTCLASQYEAPVFQVRSCIGRSDDLVAGKSYYIVEVEAVLELVTASASAAPHLFLFDELFRGTNAAERIGAAEAVLTEIVVDGATFKPHVVLAATHDGELVDLLRGSYVSCHFTDTLGPDGLVFDYRLQPGPATTRNAIALLQLHGAPARLVNRALARAAALDDQRQLSARGGDPPPSR